MPTCFVIQPFDGGPFDKRYEDTLAPAIREAGIDPYRVDRDESAVIPIESIERGIQDSDVCLADISTDNPNVWFEVGFAIARRKHVVLVCSQDRLEFPFDVQHRTIIRYKTEAKRDFEELASEVTRRLKAVIKIQAEIADVSHLSPIANMEGLSEHEIVALIIIATDLEGPVAAYAIRRDMVSAGYSEIAVSLAVRSLLRKEFVTTSIVRDDFRNDEFRAFEATEAGFRWLENNQSKLTLRQPTSKPANEPVADEDDIPF